MSVHKNLELIDMLVQVSELYLNPSFSDILFIIGDEKLPAHQSILGQRCSVFKTMFLEEESDSKVRSIVLDKTPLAAFKHLLKFIYTGALELKEVEVNDLLDTLQLASTYEMPRLQQLCLDQLKAVCKIDNVVEIINEMATRLQHGVIVDCFGCMTAIFPELFWHDSFKSLTREALRQLLSYKFLNMPAERIYLRFVDWMMAHPREKRFYTDILKCIDLRTLAIDDIVTPIRPLDLIDSDDLLDIVFEQAKKVEHPVDNVLQPHYGAKVFAGGPSEFFTIPTKGATLKHEIGSYEPIILDLKRLYMLNYLVMEFAGDEKSYVIEVSEDNAHWTRVIDRSKYACRRVQRLYFNDRVVRFIRISGTASNNGVFEVSRLEAYHTKEQFKVDPETTLLMPSRNVATLEMDAVVIEGTAKDFINGSATGSSGCANPSLIVQLPQPYLIDTMALLFDTSDGTVNNYNMEVSNDNVNWTSVLREESVTSWRHAKFTKQPVSYVKLTGCTIDEGCPFFLTCQHLECPAITNV